MICRLGEHKVELESLSMVEVPEPESIDVRRSIADKRSDQVYFVVINNPPESLGDIPLLIPIVTKDLYLGAKFAESDSELVWYIAELDDIRERLLPTLLNIK